MSRFWRCAAACGIAAGLMAAYAFAGASGYRILRKIPIRAGGEATWDYISVDETGRRLFVAHENEVEVVHAETGKMLGTIEAKGAHAIGLIPEFKHGFITNGLNATVTMFDLDTLKKIMDIPAGELPDGIAYDPVTKRVFSFNTVGINATAIEAKDGKVAGTIKFDGKPEQAVADGTGHVFVAIKDKGAIARIDSQKLVVDKEWPIKGCDRATSLNMNTKTHRLFLGCRDLTQYVVDSDTGRVVAELPIGDNVDNTMFDPTTGLIFTSTEDGIITVIHEDGPEKYRVVDTIKTMPGSKTMTLDHSTHQLFVPYGEVEKLPPVQQKKTGGKVDMSGVRRRVVANTFGVLVVGR